ncbi:hypothetical protein EYC84_007000 [Monilinia fructicola]|uniref:Uncharacterized protein n=1 Tax=Monilinia fructicola TaxID=38448 RepID=A0A5M9K573_MONFR|nr:hypothetical protein EYC84_007000 [Monilinia fructicola]
MGGVSVQRPLRNTSSPNIPEQIVESPGRGVTSSPRNFSPLSSPFGGHPTSPGTNTSSRSMAPTSEPNQFSPSQFHSSTTSQMGSESGSNRDSFYNHHANTSSSIFAEDGDDIPLSHRRDLIRQSTQQPLIQPATSFNSHQPRRQSGAINPMAREQQLATWRASVTHDCRFINRRRWNGVERQRSVLWQERRAEEMRRAVERSKKEEREERRDERMRANGAGMEELHRKMLSRMQDEARRNDVSL